KRQYSSSLRRFWPLGSHPTLTQRSSRTPNRPAGVLGGCWVITQPLEALQELDSKPLPLSRPRLLGVWSREGPAREQGPLGDERAWGGLHRHAASQHLTGKHRPREDGARVFA